MPKYNDNEVIGPVNSKKTVDEQNHVVTKRMDTETGYMTSDVEKGYPAYSAAKPFKSPESLGIVIRQSDVK